jgi:hypothetical protein
VKYVVTSPLQNCHTRDFFEETALYVLDVAYIRYDTLRDVLDKDYPLNV